ncbi:LppU/SCO3897 family protein [Polymorphospora rubra]|uniref:Uncharacterized protein n=1 Tax=Polymorphospora rubra TaxID=338584 RepID=A0A810MTK9_9ACTN|nr:hypothetical protein [Polymorphospora rubra]BCJ64411.1 hypothetical protein Prubr_14320 [Polymorphospora rubra]
MSEQVAPPPPPPAGAPNPSMTPPPPPAPPSRGKAFLGGIAKQVIGVVVVLVVIAVGGFIWNNLTGDPSTASVGDCLVGEDEDTLKVIDCGDATAQWKVVGKVEDKSESEFRASEGICAVHPTSEIAYWWGKPGGNGDVLCMEPAAG